MPPIVAANVVTAIVQQHHMALSWAGVNKFVFINYNYISMLDVPSPNVMFPKPCWQPAGQSQDTEANKFHENDVPRELPAVKLSLPTCIFKRAHMPLSVWPAACPKYGWSHPHAHELYVT
jgi:hypothetical protein